MRWQDDIEPPDEDEEPACTCTLIHHRDPALGVPEWEYVFDAACSVHSFLLEDDPGDAFD